MATKRHPLYYTWRSQKSRCLNPNNDSYKHYGAKGISMSDEFINDFKAWAEYVGPRPSNNHTIDRIDGSKGYERGNMRWANHFVQNENKSDNIIFTYNGETKCLMDWCRYLGMNYNTVHARISNLGWSIEKALFTKPKNRGQNKPKNNLMLSMKGETKHLKEWALQAGLSYGCLRNRIFERGMSLEKAISLKKSARGG